MQISIWIGARNTLKIAWSMSVNNGRKNGEFMNVPPACPLMSLAAAARQIIIDFLKMSLLAKTWFMSLLTSRVIILKGLENSLKRSWSAMLQSLAEIKTAMQMINRVSLDILSYALGSNYFSWRASSSQYHNLLLLLSKNRDDMTPNGGNTA